MHISFVAESLNSNSLGRVYSLWLLAEKLGWQTQILSAVGEKIWAPLENSAFASFCKSVPASSLAEAIDPSTDLLIACKPLAASLGASLGVVERTGLPLLVDIDDPDLEALLRIGRPLEAVARGIRHPRRTLRDLRLRKAARQLPSLVSNPWLLSRYGGDIVPHARHDPGGGRFSDRVRPRVAFVGTNRRHKGVGILRQAVARLQDRGFTLTVTDQAPRDPHPWEAWVGQTSLEDGLTIVREADIVAIPSLRVRQAQGQLPAKLIDAMLLARAVVVTDVEPMPWAVGDTASVVRAGSVSELSEALAALCDPVLRERLGRAARARALREFSTDALAEKFGDACRRTVAEVSRTRLG